LASRTISIVFRGFTPVFISGKKRVERKDTEEKNTKNESKRNEKLDRIN